MRLTDDWLKDHNGQETQRVREISDGHGLSVRRNPKGKLVFQMRYVLSDVARRLDLGVYPEMSLDEARHENARLRSELKRGRDPKLVMQADRQARHAGTLEQLFRIWLDVRGDDASDSRMMILRTFERDVLPTIGHLQCRDTTLEDWLMTLHQVKTEQPSAIESIVANGRLMLEWAVSTGIIQANALSARGAQESIQRLLQPRPALDTAPILAAVASSAMTKRGKRLLMLLVKLVARHYA